MLEDDIVLLPPDGSSGWAGALNADGKGSLSYSAGPGAGFETANALSEIRSHEPENWGLGSSHKQGTRVLPAGGVARTVVLPAEATALQRFPGVGEEDTRAELVER